MPTKSTPKEKPITISPRATPGTAIVSVSPAASTSEPASNVQTTDQVSEKTRLRLEQQGEDLKYSELMKAVDAIREAAEIEEKEMRNFLKTQVREENAKLAESQRVARRDPNANISREELLAATSLNLFDETAGNAMDATGHIIRRDMFKGYTDAQRKRILQENEEVARQARESRSSNKDSDAVYAEQQMQINRAMEYAAWEEKRVRNELKEEYNASLRQQAAEQAKRKEQWNKEKYGAIDPNFYSSFGNSAR